MKKLFLAFLASLITSSIMTPLVNIDMIQLPVLVAIPYVLVIAVSLAIITVWDYFREDNRLVRYEKIYVSGSTPLD